MFRWCDCWHLDPPTGEWQARLCGCCQHPTNAFVTALLPCVTFGLIMEAMEDEGISCVGGCICYLLLMPLCCCHWMAGCYARGQLRKKYELLETPCNDTLVHIFCPFCALCQEFRELKHHGLDPDLAWRGIFPRWQQQKPPKIGDMQQNVPPNQFMSR